jgi:hypothetical protein
MNNLNDFFQDDKGGQSATRLITILAGLSILFIFISSNLVMLFNALFRGGVIDIVDFKPQMVYILGVAMAAKIFQKFAETKDNAQQAEEKPVKPVE